MDGTSGDGGDIQSGGSGAVEEGQGEPPSLATLVEKTFVMAASANSYVEGLDAFIRVVKEAYERGYTVPALMMEISFVPTKVGWPILGLVTGRNRERFAVGLTYCTFFLKINHTAELGVSTEVHLEYGLRTKSLDFTRIHSSMTSFSAAIKVV